MKINKKHTKILIFILLGVVIAIFALGFYNRVRMWHYVYDERLKDWQACNYAMEMARENIKLGNYIAYFPIYSRYAEEVAFNLYGIMLNVHVRDPYYNCGSQYMEKAIFEKFGEDIFYQIERKADSIYSIKTNVETTIDGYYDTNGEKDSNDYVRTIKIIRSKIEESGLLDKISSPSMPKRLYFDFIVFKTGKIGNIRIIYKSIPEINELLLRTINELPFTWRPVSVDGKIVDYRITMYIALCEDITDRLIDFE